MSVALIVLVIGTLAAAVSDLRSRRIPNALTATMAVAAVALHAASGTTVLLTVFGVMIASFALGSFAYAAGWLGGGDVKLIAAACGLASYPGSITLVLYVAIAGAVLALVEAARRQRLVAIIRSATALALSGSVPQTQTLLPYGVAIAGGSAAYAFSTLFSGIRHP